MGRRIGLVVACLAAAAIAFVAWDIHEPERIALTQDELLGVSVLRAPDLLVQGRDETGRLWASRGMWAYRMSADGTAFERQYRVPTGVTVWWLRNLATVRWLTRRPECIELVASADGSAVAMSAGRIWYKSGDGTDFEPVFTLRHYGIGDQGVRHDGIVRLADGSYLLGEYFRNPQTGDVRVYGSPDGRDWSTYYTFPAGTVRHIHALQQNPADGAVWLLAGDAGPQARVLTSSDGGRTFAAIGQGSQEWRVTQVAFDGSHVYWGADTEDETAAGLYRWDSAQESLTRLMPLAGAAFYATRLNGGTVVLSTNREGFPNERDPYTRLLIKAPGADTFQTVRFGEWAYREKYAKLRFSRNQGGDALAVTVLNHTSHNNDLILFPESALAGLNAGE